MGSGINCQGFRVLLQAIDKYFPSPDKYECVGVDVSTGERFTAKYNDDVSLSARVFKTIVDPFIGKYSLMKVCTGTLKPDSVVYNVNKETEERIGKIYLLRGKDQIEVLELKAGDIGAVAKLAVTQTGDTMAVRTAPIVYHKPQISTPYTYMAYKAVNKGDDDKISSALSKLMEEDLTLKVVNDGENRQALLYAIGDQQLDVVVSKLQNRYKVDVTLEKPKFAFRETLKKKVKVQGKHKKQSGGHGQFGDVWIEFEPCDSEGLVFEENVFGGSVPKNFFPAVEKGLQECVRQGTIAGYPVVGLKATLVDGSYHPVDSSEMAFKTAASLAYKAGLPMAGPVLLEPIGSLSVTVPDANTGDIIGELNKRRGRVLGMNPLSGGYQEIQAEVPMSEMLDFSIILRSISQGRGDFTLTFERYEQLPQQLEAAVIEEAKAMRAEGE
jgi:elongation factor G